ncbi:MAG: hypothetical protein V4667_05590 [Bacteroidota bacterium]
MKKVYSLVLVSVAILALNSCKKVSDNKLNGEWNVVSGSLSTSSTNSGGTTETTTTFDGVTISGTTKYTPANVSATNQPNTTTIETPTTLSIKFDKKTNKYTTTTVQKTTSKTNVSYYTAVSNGYVSGGFIERRSEINTTIVEDGIYRITGGTGDVKKNSQIMFIPSSTVSTSNYVYSYYTTDTETAADISDKYKQIISGLVTKYEPLSASLTESSTSTTTTEKNNQAVIWTVNDLKKGSMDISYSTTQSTSVSGSSVGTTTNTNVVNYKLSEK